jgi:hypothetical protein
MIQSGPIYFLFFIIHKSKTPVTRDGDIQTGQIERMHANPVTVYTVQGTKKILT